MSLTFHIFSASFYWNEHHCYPQGHSQMSVSVSPRRSTCTPNLDPSTPSLVRLLSTLKTLKHRRLAHTLMSFTLHASPATPGLLVAERCPISLCQSFSYSPASLLFYAALLIVVTMCANLPLQPSRAVSSDLRTTRLLVVPYYLCVRFLSVSAAVLCLGFNLS